MAQDQTVVDHLLAGRQALHDDVGQAEAEIARLQTEVQRLSTAIDQLDSVITMINSGELASLPARTEAVAAPPASVASAAPTAPAAARVGAPAKRTASRTRKPGGQAPKSIRVHVLEMLAAEDRDWSLAEIIDRIHDAGIQAHDDAVRSITIKLMKDGRVERVGRGQYRLARRGSTRTTVPSATAAPAAEPVTEAPADTEPAAEPALDEAPVDEAPVDEALVDEAPVDEAPVADDPTAADAAEDAVEDAPVDETGAGEPETVTPAQPEPAESTRAYTPPLNLGQPWN